MRIFSSSRGGVWVVILGVIVWGETLARGQYPAAAQIGKDGWAVIVEDYASLPVSSRTTGAYPPPINYGGQLGRVNFLRSEPPNAPLSASRLFVADLNRNLYILDKTTRAFTTYINFEEVFPKFDDDPGYAGGLVTFAFDPDYANNHRFYTVHTEDPARSGSATPTNGSLPGLVVSGYTTTTAVNPPAGTVAREAVLVEWTDSNLANATFEGTARELLRVGFNSVIHPMGDLLFNPTAQPGDSDYGNLYIANGDGGAGETSGAQHPLPQRLDALSGKILRITPDTSLRPADLLSPNGRYRIPTNGPDPNPFSTLTLAGVRKEIYAYGFRNPHRLTWDPAANKALINDIGLHSWEEVNILARGANYGYAEREGIEQVFIGGANDGKTGSQTTPATPFPSPDSLNVTGLGSPVTPVYPVAAYSHRDGDATSSGAVYRGALIPLLRGRYVFGDITTGRLFHTPLDALLATDDGARTNVAPVHELQIVYHGAERRLFDIAHDAFVAKGGNAGGSALPGGCGGLRTGGNDSYGVPYGCGRADIRLAQDSDGEIYLLSKSDGMIRKLVGLAAPPVLQVPQVTNGVVTLRWSAISNHQYRVQFRGSPAVGGWTDLAGDLTATNSVATKTNALAGDQRCYRVRVLP